MNLWQAKEQIAHDVRNLEWTSGGTKLFREVFVTNAPSQEILNQHIPPLCLVRSGSGSHTPNFQSEIEQKISLEIITSVGGDKTGVASTQGKDRTVDTSKGAGIEEYISFINEALQDSFESKGYTFSLLAESDEPEVRLGNHSSVMSKKLNYTARLTTEKTFDPPWKAQFRAEVNGSSVDLSWGEVSSRFDINRIVIRRGAVLPVTETEGDGVSLPGSPLSGGTVTDSPGAGTWYYVLFAIYIDRPNYDPVYSDNSVRQKVTV